MKKYIGYILAILFVAVCITAVIYPKIGNQSEIKTAEINFATIGQANLILAIVAENASSTRFLFANHASVIDQSSKNIQLLAEQFNLLSERIKVLEAK